MPSFSPAFGTPSSAFAKHPVSEDTEHALPIVRQSDVVDLGNGNYTVRLCPVIAGYHEVHVLLNAQGVSNMPQRILDRAISRTQAMGRESYTGQYVDSSPYLAIVKNGKPNAFTSTAEGKGTHTASVGVAAEVIVTVRDAWDNVYLKNASYNLHVTASLLRSPTSNIGIWNFNNGSHKVTYFATKFGENVLSIYVNNFEVKGSPFTVNVIDGPASSNYSYADGLGTSVSTVNQSNYFVVYSVSGINYYQIVPVATVTTTNYTYNNTALTPIQAYNMDIKLDDGLPGTGVVLARALTGINLAASIAANPTANTCTLGTIAATATFNRVPTTGGNDPSCSLQFRFN
jgi:hypothetical protein